MEAQPPSKRARPERRRVVLFMEVAVVTARGGEKAPPNQDKKSPATGADVRQGQAKNCRLVHTIAVMI
jgi:hypothetical protein